MVCTVCAVSVFVFVAVSLVWFFVCDGLRFFVLFNFICLRCLLFLFSCLSLYICMCFYFMFMCVSCVLNRGYRVVPREKPTFTCGRICDYNFFPRNF